MDSFFATICFLAYTIMINAIAIPEENGLSVSSAAQMSVDDMVIVNMTVYDPRFPGVTFTGTAQSVYQQMGYLKPDEFPDIIDNSQAHSLAKRSTLNCDYGTDTLGPKACQNNYNYLKGLDRANCCVNGGAGTCARVACSSRCGNFLCNNTNGQFCASCGDIATDMKYITDHCDHAATDTAGGARDFDTHFVGQSGTHGC